MCLQMINYEVNMYTHGRSVLLWNLVWYLHATNWFFGSFCNTGYKSKQRWPCLHGIYWSLWLTCAHIERSSRSITILFWTVHILAHAVFCSFFVISQSNHYNIAHHNTTIQQRLQLLEWPDTIATSKQSN